MIFTRRGGWKTIVRDWRREWWATQRCMKCCRSRDVALALHKTGDRGVGQPAGRAQHDLSQARLSLRLECIVCSDAPSVEVAVQRDVPHAARGLRHVDRGAVQVTDHLVEGDLPGACWLVPHVEGVAKLLVLEGMQIEVDGLAVRAGERFERHAGLGETHHWDGASSSWEGNAGRHSFRWRGRRLAIPSQHASYSA